MVHINKLKLMLAGLLAFPGMLMSQDFIGLNTGSWGGLHTLHLNPANVVDSRYKVDINLVSVNVTASNNYIAAKNSFLFDVNNKSQENDWESKYLLVDSLGTNPKNAHVNATILGPSFMFNITPKDAIAFTVRGRVQVSAEDMDQQTANLIYNGLANNQWGIPFSADYASVRYNSWVEWGLTYGRVILDKKEHFLKAGVTLKFLQGLGSAYATVKDYRLVFQNNDVIDTLNGNVSYGHSGNLVPGNVNGQFTMGSNAGFSLEAAGGGADIGVVYEWRPSWQKYRHSLYGKKSRKKDESCKLIESWNRWEDAYVLKASLALNNIGSIRYTKDSTSRDYIAQIRNMNVNVFNDIQNIYDIDNKLDSLAAAGQLINATNNNRDYFLDMPLTLNMGLDWHVIDGFYLNVQSQIAFNQGPSDPHRLNNLHTFYFTPRYENAWFGAYMPVGYRQYSGFNWGLGLRLGPVIIGSGDIFSNLVKGETNGIDLFVGAKIPIPHMAPRDRDKDMVRDKFDKCKDVPGVCYFQGCPDTDRDSIPDSEDECPTVPGLPEFRGCPDTDGDGIPDKDDKCPTDPGPKELQGCPDRDFDGVIDREDDCPDEKGLPEYNGCPDTDGDGVIDKLDQCPTLPGPKDQFGCPDTDGDGIYDNVDACPTEKGLPELNGCPYADTDKDGIRDIDDKCPDQPGPIENGGCPYADTDGDGIIDLEDKCPNTPGVKENFGCPPIAKEEQEVLKRAFDNLEFNTGKSTIRTSSYASLDELAELLKKKPEYKLLIEGHTDNVGSRTSNITLSKNRATAVKNYLVKKGVAASRFVVNWFGPDKPIDTNDTDEGRQRNRRVEMTVIFD